MDNKQVFKAIMVIVIGSVIGTIANHYVQKKLKGDCNCQNSNQ